MHAKYTNFACMSHFREILMNTYTALALCVTLLAVGVCQADPKTKDDLILERLASLQKSLDGMHTGLKKDISTIEKKVATLEKEVEYLRNKMKEKIATREVEKTAEKVTPVETFYHPPVQHYPIFYYQLPPPVFYHYRSQVRCWR